MNAMENLSEAMALFDANGRLLFCNRLYREIGKFDSDVSMEGLSLEDIQRHMIAKDQIPEASDDIEGW